MAACGGLFHFGQHVMVRPDADRAEETRQHQFAAGDIARAFGHQIVADYAEVRAEIKDVPVLLAQDAQVTCRGGSTDSTRG